VLSDVQGQEEAVRVLRRVVDGRWTDPLLLIGDEGTGRRFSVIQAIKEVCCQGTRDLECTCRDCTQINFGVHPNVSYLTTIDDKSIKVDTIREMVEAAKVQPTLAPIRVVIVDGVDRLTIEAANAFLKTLEEPPPRTRFFLLAEFDQFVLPTIRSRCGKVSYRPLPEGIVLSVLQRFMVEPGNASIYARMGEGSVGRSLSYSETGRLGLRDRVFGLLQLALAGDLPGLFSAIDSIGQDLPLALRFVEHLLHDVLMISIDPDRLINLDLREGVQRLQAGTDLSSWVQLGQGVREARERYRWTSINLAFRMKALFAEAFFAG
jgi:DNA polymerase III subunit delta'